MLEDMEAVSTAVRSKVEEALRFFIKLPLRKPAEGGAFLEIPGPGNEAIEFYESEARVELRFGFSGESFDFSGTWGDDDGDKEEVTPEVLEAELEEEFKDELEALVNTALDIIEESVFSAQYEKLSVRMGGLFPAEEFAEMKSSEAFESVSWNGKYDSGPKGA